MFYNVPHRDRRSYLIKEFTNKKFLDEVRFSFLSLCISGSWPGRFRSPGFLSPALFSPGFWSPAILSPEPGPGQVFSRSEPKSRPGPEFFSPYSIFFLFFNPNNPENREKFWFIFYDGFTMTLFRDWTCVSRSTEFRKSEYFSRNHAYFQFKPVVIGFWPLKPILKLFIVKPM